MTQLESSIDVAVAVCSTYVSKAAPDLYRIRYDSFWLLYTQRVSHASHLLYPTYLVASGRRKALPVAKSIQ